jgi:hypothetical protein
MQAFREEICDDEVSNFIDGRKALSRKWPSRQSIISSNIATEFGEFKMYVCGAM